MKLNITLFLLFAVAMSACNNDVFVDDESVNNISYQIASGDSVKVKVKAESLGSATLTLSKRTKVEVYNHGGGCTSSDSVSHLVFYFLDRVSRVELSSGLYRSTIRVNPDMTLTYSSTQSLDTVPVQAKVELHYGYSTRTLSFETLPFEGVLKLKDLHYGDYYTEYYGDKHRYLYGFENTENVEKQFVVEPFKTRKRRIVFELAKELSDCYIDIEEPLIIPLPSLPIEYWQSGGVGFYGLTDTLKLGTHYEPSLLADKKITVKVPPHTSRMVDFYVDELIITNSFTLECVNSLNPSQKIFLPGNMLVVDDNLYHTEIKDSPI